MGSWIFFRLLYAIAKIAIITARIILHLIKTSLLVKSDFELWSVTCIEHELWSLTSFAHGQFNLFTTTFNWIYILSQWLVRFNRSLLVTFLHFNFTFFLLADFDPFLFVNRLLKYGTTANAVHSEERMCFLLELVSSVLPWFWHIMGLALICLLFTDVVSWRPNTKMRAFV